MTKNGNDGFKQVLNETQRLASVLISAVDSSSKTFIVSPLSQRHSTAMAKAKHRNSANFMILLGLHQHSMRIARRVFLKSESKAEKSQDTQAKQTKGPVAPPNKVNKRHVSSLKQCQTSFYATLEILSTTSL